MEMVMSDKHKCKVEEREIIKIAIIQMSIANIKQRQISI